MPFCQSCLEHTAYILVPICLPIRTISFHCPQIANLWLPMMAKLAPHVPKKNLFPSFFLNYNCGVLCNNEKEIHNSVTPPNVSYYFKGGEIFNKKISLFKDLPA